MLFSGIELGRTRQGKRISLNPKVRETHMHVIGASGRGKSKFLEHMIWEDIKNKQGLCLIDPHGYLYNDIVRWCETSHLLDIRKIVLFDPSSDEWAFGFNPFVLGDRDIASCVDAMVKACAQVWGGEDTNQTPLLKRCLRSVFHALAEQELTFLETRDLVNPVDLHGVRRHITNGIKDPIFREQWETFNVLKPREFMEQFGSTYNRIIEFLSAERIRNIIGQQERVINFRKFMDEGYIVLVNLSAGERLSDDNARLLGTLLVNDMFLKVRTRPKGSRPFYLYIDECSLFINEDIGRILDEARKFGLHLILAHQHLSQLKTAGEKVYSAVMTNAQTKVVFGGLQTEDARVMAEQVFIGEYNLEETKHTFDRPTVVGHVRTWLQSHAHGQSHGRSTGTGRSTSEGGSEGEAAGGSESRSFGRSFGDTFSYPYDSPNPYGSHAQSDLSSRTDSTGRSWTQNSTRNRSEAFSEMESENYAESEMYGRSEAFEPIYEILPGQGYSLEEQIYKSMALMVNQPTQRAIVKFPGKHSVRVKTPDVADGYASDERVEQFKERAFQLSDFATSVILVEKEINERRLRLEQNAALPPNIMQGTTNIEEPDDFRG